MGFNIGQALTAGFEIYADVEADTAELESGAVTSVPLPGSIQVGSVGGKPLYLAGELTTVRPTIGAVIAGPAGTSAPA